MGINNHDLPEQTAQPPPELSRFRGRRHRTSLRCTIPITSPASCHGFLLRSFRTPAPGRNRGDSARADTLPRQARVASGIEEINLPKSHREIELIARGLYIRDQRILVCRNLAGGYCYLPGGHVEFGEPAAAALARELQEEIGLEAIIGDLILATEEVFETRGKRHHEVNLVFHVERMQDGLVRSLEPEIDFDWVDRTQLAEEDLRPASIRNWIASRDPATIGAMNWISSIRA